MKKHTKTKRTSVYRLNKLFSWFFCLLIILMPVVSSAIEGKLNINTATAKELMALPFIGQAKAKEIINYRKKTGNFSDLEELKKISAIGQSTFEAIKPYLTISGSSNLITNSVGETSSLQVFPRIDIDPGQIILLPNSRYFATLISFIRQAEQSINLAMFIFKTTKSPKNRPALVVNELIAASKRGVNIRVTLEKSGYDPKINEENSKVARKLRRNNIEVFLDSEKTTSHAKIVVVDNRFCFVGSHNFTHSALKYNNEFSLLLDNKTLAKELLNFIKTIK